MPSQSNIKFCSVECSSQMNRKVKDPPLKEELEKMISSMSWVDIGKKYGVSDNTIKQWAKKYDIEWDKRTRYLENIICPMCNIEFKPKSSKQKLCSSECSRVYGGYRKPPTKEDLEQKLSELSSKEISEYYGVHRKTIWDWRKKYKI